MTRKIKILFISRAYPPVVGGIENQNWELSAWLSRIAEVKTIANRHGKKFLPLFLPYAFLKAFFLLPKFDVILLGDAVLSIIGWKLKLFSKKPVISILHGLDLTYKMKLYQKLWVNKFLKKIDKFIAVGNETVRIAKTKGISEDKIVFIPNGIDPGKFLLENARKSDLEKIIREDLSGKKTILTSGRLARRKGAAWFVRKVMPKLPENFIYIIAGNGPDRQNIQEAIQKNNLEKRVKVLGYVTDEVRDILFNTCDLFVQPNIKLEGDVEGFGISVIEAASAKIPVVASNLEGLKDAIKDGQDGFLVESGNAEKYAQKIIAIMADDNFRRQFGEKARQFVVENYSWEKISRMYLGEMERVIGK